MTRSATKQELKSTSYELFIAGVALLSIVNMVLIIVVREPQLAGVLNAMNSLCSAILLGDFAYRLRTAPSRSQYFFRRFGWADLLSCLPMAQLKVFRLFRLVRVFRLLRGLGTRRVLRTIVDNTAGSALLTLLFLALLVMEFGSLSMLQLEQDAPGARITTASDALWYMIVTMATVGYGDEYPVTSAGRLLGSFVIIVGVGIFGTLTGYLSNAFLRSRGAQPEETGMQRRSELQELRQQQLDALHRIDRLLAAEPTVSDPGPAPSPPAAAPGH